MAISKSRILLVTMKRAGPKAFPNPSFDRQHCNCTPSEITIYGYVRYSTDAIAIFKLICGLTHRLFEFV